MTDVDDMPNRVGKVSNTKNQAIDFSVIADYIGNDVASHKKLIQAFISSTPEMIKLILLNAESGSLDIVVSESHKLKSTSKTVGALAMSDKALLIESTGKENDREFVRKNSNDLSELFKDYSQKAIAQYGVIL